MLLTLLKHWRVIAACVAIGGAFFAGWTVQGWKGEAALKAAHEAQSAELVALIERRNERRQAEIEAEAAARRTLELQLAAERQRSAALREDIANADLSESRPADPVEDSDYRCPTPLASPDFIRLWNEAARRNH